jgi:DNA mismatch endonuclease (patch repair protein)
LDTFSQKERSAIMRKVKSKNTGPEKKVRSLVHRLGYRFRIHRNDLPGKPDMVFPCRKKIIFVHGCFWHDHNCKAGRNKPKSNIDYWNRKIRRNAERDKKNQEALKERKWEVLVIWECEIKDETSLKEKLQEFLEGSGWNGR